MSDLKKYIWDQLLRSVAAGRCIPFLGAGASSPPVPTAHELAEQIGKSVKVPEYCSGDLSKVAEFADFVVHRDYLIWLLERLIPLNVEPNQTHLNLSVLPWEIVRGTPADEAGCHASTRSDPRPKASGECPKQPESGHAGRASTSWSTSYGRKLQISRVRTRLTTMAKNAMSTRST
jgi:hypothetical protein